MLIIKKIYLKNNHIYSFKKIIYTHVKLLQKYTHVNNSNFYRTQGIS